MGEQITTETEQLYDDLTAAETDEQPEDTTEETTDEQPEDEEILTEEQLEVARTIADYQTKIEAMDDKLAEFKAESVLNTKREALRESHYNEEQIARYVGHIEGNTTEEINRAVLKLAGEIPPVDGFADPSAFNWAKEKGTTDRGEQLRQIGKDAFERVKHKIRF